MCVDHTIGYTHHTKKWYAGCNRGFHTTFGMIFILPFLLCAVVYRTFRSDPAEADVNWIRAYTYAGWTAPHLSISADNGLWTCRHGRSTVGAAHVGVYTRPEFYGIYYIMETS